MGLTAQSQVTKKIVTIKKKFWEKNMLLEPIQKFFAGTPAYHVETGHPIIQAIQ